MVSISFESYTSAPEAKESINNESLSVVILGSYKYDSVGSMFRVYERYKPVVISPSRLEKHLQLKTSRIFGSGLSMQRRSPVEDGMMATTRRI